MNADDFRRALPDAVRDHLPAELQKFRHAMRFGYVQFWFGDSVFHYEISTQSRLGVIEVGLHFEHKDSKRNAMLHRYFDECFVEIRELLGEVWLEQWDKGWHKLYVTLPLEKYNEALLEDVSREMARHIIVLQPLLREAIATLPSTKGK
jgi:hypothetical protein